MTAPTRAVSMRRVSTSDQSGDLKTSLAKQADSNAAMAERHGWRIVGGYEEAGISGALDLEDRPQVQEMIKDAAAGEFEIAIFFHPDRLGRDMFESMHLAKKLARAGVAIAFSEHGRIFEDVTEDDMEALTFFLEAWRAHGDYRNIIAKTWQGRFDAADKHGLWPGAPAPYGLQVAEDRLSLVIDPDEAPGVRLAFEMRAAGASSTQIVRRLADEGYQGRPRRRKGEAEPTRSALTRSVVLDWFKKTYYRGEPITKSMKRGKGGTVEEISWPTDAIVDRGLWQRAHEADPVSRRPRRKTQRRYALSNRVVHVHPDGTEHPLHGVPSRTKGQGKGGDFRRLYACSAGRVNSQTTEKIGCPGFGLAGGRETTRTPAEIIEARFAIWALDKLADEDALRAYARRADERQADVDPDHDLDKLRGKLDKLTTKIERYGELYADGDLSRERYEQRAATVKSEIAAVERLIEGAENDRTGAVEEWVPDITLADLLAASVSDGTDPEDDTPPLIRGSEEWRVELGRAALTTLKTRGKFGRIPALPEWAVDEIAFLAEAFNARLVVTGPGTVPEALDDDSARWPEAKIGWDERTLPRLARQYGGSAVATVSQERPAWNPSRQIFSKRR